MNLKERIKKLGLNALDRKQKAALAVAVFLLSGFLWAGLANFSDLTTGLCTQVRCSCYNYDFNETNPPDRITSEHRENITGGVACNSCGGYRVLYHIGFFWVTQEEKSTQMYICEEGEKVGEYYRTDALGEIKAGNIFTGEPGLREIAEILYRLSQEVLNLR